MRREEIVAKGRELVSNGWENAVAIDLAPANIGFFDVRSLEGMDNRVGKVGRGQGAGRVQIEDAEVCMIADFEFADVGAAERACALDGCHIEDVPSGECGWVARDAFMDERGEVHFFEHVEIIIRGAAVRTKCDIDAERVCLWDACEAAAEFHIAGGVVDERDVMFAHDTKVVIGAIDAMRGITTVVEEAR